MEFRLLTKEFYDKYFECKEILRKKNRPYFVYLLKIDDLIFAIPIRHNIKHKYAIKTIENQGLDFTKTVVFKDRRFLTNYTVKIEKEEYFILSERKALIKKGLERYIKLYKKALKHPLDNKNKILLENSSLQYFHNELGIEV